MKRLFRKLRFWFRSVTNPDNEQPQKEPPRVVRPAERNESPVSEVEAITKMPTEQDKRRRSNLYYEAYYHTLVIKETKRAAINRVITRIKKNKSRYINAQLLTGVDWRIIAAIHNLEASGNFAKQILNGQSYTRRTTIVPKKQGPWKSWEESCIAAFKYHPLKSNNLADVLRFLERYNGTGYIKRGLNSPYLFSYSNYYSKGKYVKDGKFSSSAVSQQVGAAVVLKELGY